MPPPTRGMFRSFWDKSNKWKYPQCWGRGSENSIRFEFWPLFVTKNGILRFSAFGLIKWSWVKNSKWNHPQFGGRGSQKHIGYEFWLLFVTENGIFRFSVFVYLMSRNKTPMVNNPSFLGKLFAAKPRHNVFFLISRWEISKNMDSKKVG